MKKQWETPLMIGGIILTAIIVVVAILFATGKISFEKMAVNVKQNNDVDTYEQTIRESKEKYPTEIFVYGDDCNFREEVEYTKITELSAEQVASNKEFQVIIINDLKGELNLTNEDMDFIQKYGCEYKRIVMYFGDNQLDKFVEEGIVSGLSLSSEDMGLVYKYHEVPSMRVSVIWHDEDNDIYMNNNEEILGSVIFNYLRNYYMDFDLNASK